MNAHLHILQLEGYQPLRFLRWWVRNPFKFRLENKKPLVWTRKAKFIYALSGGFWPLMFAALVILWPFEESYRLIIRLKVKMKIEKLKKCQLKVIGITGSYGKTSTKELLYQILKQKYRVLRTPESYNTVFGIAKIVDLELDNNYDFFICEMGAYKRGEIKELCEMVDPDYGILTGINEQHLERFGSMQNIIKAKYELVGYLLANKGMVVVNNSPLRPPLNLRGGLERVLYYGKRKHQHPMEQNIEGAMRMARILGVTQRPKSFLHPDHRLKVINRGDNLTIIDDAYSANVTGFEAAIKYLKKFTGYKIVITPGITELGLQTREIHKKMGKLLNQVADMVVLVGNNERTVSLSQSLSPGRFEFVNSVGQWRQFVDPKIKTVLLFENDLPDNY